MSEDTPDQGAAGQGSDDAAAEDRGPYTCPECGLDYGSKEAICTGKPEAGHAPVAVVKFPPPDDYEPAAG